jgi:aromatic amino acid aminotransferase I
MQPRSGYRLTSITGLPHPSLFPLQRAKFECLPSSANLASSDSTNGESPDLLDITFGRGQTPGDMDLTQFLQYGK